MAEAQRIFWRQTVVPLVQRLAKALSQWQAPADVGMVPGFSLTPSMAPQALEFRPDLDQLPALAPERDALWQSLEKVSFLTDDEKRALIGYGPKPATAKFNPHHLPAGPGGGQFTTAPDGEGDGSERPQPAQSRGPRNFGKPPGGGGGGKRPGSGHNDPPGPIPPIPPIVPPPSSDQPAPGSNPPIPPGMTLRNQALAGKTHPESGIPFDNDGFPDFSGVATKTVQVPHTGDRLKDFKAADDAAGFYSTNPRPSTMTWHHPR